MFWYAVAFCLSLAMIVVGVTVIMLYLADRKGRR